MDRDLTVYEPPMVAEVGEFSELTNGSGCQGDWDGPGCCKWDNTEIE